MSNFGEDAMDFGDDDDGEFLTGKLAALGIDEDLELSGGEEENEDPAVVIINNDAAAATTATKKPEDADGGIRIANEHRSQHSRTSDTATISAGVSTHTPSPSSQIGKRDQKNSRDLTEGAIVAEPGGDCGGRDGGAIEEGELLEMLEKPLQASRDARASSGSHNNRDVERNTASLGRGGEAAACGSRKGKKGRARGRSSKKSNGQAKGRNVTIRECAKWVCDRLEEPKYYLMCQVVAAIGYNTSKRLLDEVRLTQEAGGMPTADGARKRTPGGVFFTLLKQHLEPAKLKALYADEVRVKKEKERARRSANKRKAEEAEMGVDIVMTPRDPPRRHDSSRSGMDMGRWVSPGGGGSSAKRVRAAVGGRKGRGSVGGTADR